VSYASDTVDDTYAEFGVAAVYTAAEGGATVPCTIIVDLRDADARPDDGRPIVGQITIEVRGSEIAAPASQDTFAFTDLGGRARNVTVINRPWLGDEEGLVWKMWADE
jgi:hypothetical protein